MLGIAYHDVEDRDPDQAVVAVRTERMIEQLAWLRENVHGQGARITIQELMKNATGKALSAASLLRYLEAKYLEAAPQ